MEDQGKRLLLAVAIAFGIMLLWQVLFPPPEPEKEPEKTTEEQQQPKDTQPAPPTTPQEPGSTVELVGTGDPAATVEPTAADPDAARKAQEAKEREACLARDAAEPLAFDFPMFRAEFSHCGGTLASWHPLFGKPLGVLDSLHVSEPMKQSLEARVAALQILPDFS